MTGQLKTHDYNGMRIIFRGVCMVEEACFQKKKKV